MISTDLLQILRCPLNKTPLVQAGEELVARVNDLVELGKLVNKSGELVEQPVEQALCDTGATWLYPVRNDIPCLLADEAIPLEQLGPAPDSGEAT